MKTLLLVIFKTVETILFLIVFFIVLVLIVFLMDKLGATPFMNKIVEWKVSHGLMNCIINIIAIIGVLYWTCIFIYSVLPLNKKWIHKLIKNK